MFEIVIWAGNEATDRPVPPKITGYTIECSDWVCSEPSEIPSELYLSVPGLKKHSCLCCTPDPDDYACGQLAKYAEKLAKTNSGAVDFGSCQAEKRYLFPAGKISFHPVRAGDTPACVSVWFAPSERSVQKRILFAEKLFDILPFAKPVNFEEYGSAEALTGKDGSLHFFGMGPVTNVNLFDQPGAGECGCAQIMMNGEVFRYEEWKEALVRLMSEISLLYNAFFSQVIDGECQVAATHWQGIPYQIGYSCIIGKQYSALVRATENGREIAEKTFLFIDPDGPYIDSCYLSKRKKNIFGTESGSGRGYLLASDFTKAAKIPQECFESGNGSAI